jgi:carbamoyltransferase
MASAFFVSPFDRAAVLSVDALGDFASTMWGEGSGDRLKIGGTTLYPHSLGFFYTAMTQYLGFSNYGDEFKVMGLASYGRPDFLDSLRKIVRVDGQGRVVLDLTFFRHPHEGVQMTWDGGGPTVGALYSDKLVRLLGPAREPRSEITSQHENLAAALQTVFEECYFALLNHAQRKTGLKAVCLAGGCAMNSVANGKIFAKTPFTDVYIQPAAGDAGTAIGAAFYVWNQILGQPRTFEMKSSYWGPEASEKEMSQAMFPRYIGQARMLAAARLRRVPFSAETRMPRSRLPRVAWAEELS